MQQPRGGLKAILMSMEHMFVRCLNMCTNNLGTNHPDTVKSRDLLLNLWRACKQFVRIDEYMKRCEECR